MNDNTKIKAGQVDPHVGEDCPPLPTIPDEDPKLLTDVFTHDHSRLWAPVLIRLIARRCAHE
jgi:hypothetical protein